MVPKQDLKNLIEDAELCHDFSKVCKQRVLQMDQRGALANDIINDQEKTLVYMEKENKRLKMKDYFINPWVGAALGLAAGMVIQSRL